MTTKLLVPAAAFVVAAVSAPVAGQSAAPSSSPGGWTVPRTPWGDPDLQGIWPSTAMVGVPLQRAAELGDRNVLTDEEFTARQAAAQRLSEADNAEFDIDSVPEEVIARGTVGGPVSPPPHWLERGQPSRQASLVVDPPDGRLPPMSPEGTRRMLGLRAARSARGPADSYEDRSLYDRCISRGIVGSVLPVIYNNGNQIIQTPGYVALRNEMIHETRIIPLDGRPHVGSSIRTYLGDSRGHWDGDTLIVETTNMLGRNGANLNGNGDPLSDAVRVVERFTRVDAETIQYQATIDDPKTYSRPFTLSFPWKRDADYTIFEYACHEGNYALHNILSGARADEQAAAAAK
jgi:hypothetical protein